MGCILWEKDALQIERLIRGLNPWPSAFTYFEGKTLKIWEARVNKSETVFAGTVPGTILECGRNEFSAQKSAMFIYGAWSINAFNEAGLNYGVVEIPAFAGSGHDSVSNLST